MKLNLELLDHEGVIDHGCSTKPSDSAIVKICGEVVGNGGKWSARAGALLKEGNEKIVGFCRNSPHLDDDRIAEPVGIRKQKR